MILVSVEINNFRQFYGTQRIEFAQDPKKNITLIHAENGVGKTAFLNTILWCLFEQTTDNFEHSNILLNFSRKAEGKSGYYVYVEFISEGRQYIAQRQFSKTSGLQFRVFELLKNGNSSPLNNPAFFINSIIPKDMARYFFFQGEGVGRLTNNKSGNVREAIRNILGFTIAELALTDIKKIKSEYRRDLSRVDKTSEIGELQANISALENLVDGYKKQYESSKDEASYLESNLEKADQEYRESNIEVLRSKQRERDSKKNELDRSKTQLQSAYNRKADLITNFATSVFSKKIADEGIGFIDEEELKGKIPAPFNEQLVADILSTSRCICGASIRGGTEAYANIHKLIKKAADPLLINRVTRARGQLTGIRKDLHIAENQFNSTQKDLLSATKNIEVLTRELDELSVSIQGVDIEGIADKEKHRKSLAGQLTETNRRIGTLKTKLEQATKKLESIKAEENRLDARTPEIKGIKTKISFIESLEIKLETTLEKTEKDSRLLLMDKINKFLELYVRQDYIAKMSPDYDIILYDRNENKVPKSDGQSLLLSLTFISSLIHLAKDRLGASGDILLPGASAPFVIDAPFGVLDNEYKANVAREIPKAVNQVVLLLSSSHWEGTVEDVIRERVGAEYNMVLNVASKTKKDIISTITILGAKYDSVIYNADKDVTVIQEVGRYE